MRISSPIESCARLLSFTTTPSTQPIRIPITRLISNSKETAPSTPLKNRQATILSEEFLGRDMFAHRLPISRKKFPSQPEIVKSLKEHSLMQEPHLKSLIKNGILEKIACRLANQIFSEETTQTILFSELFNLQNPLVNQKVKDGLTMKTLAIFLEALKNCGQPLTPNRKPS